MAFWKMKFDKRKMNLFKDVRRVMITKSVVAEPIIMSTPQMSYVNENSQSNMKEQR